MMVSIIIPVYNGEEFLEECLDSVIGQSYRDIEIIIIDDGSTDRSFSICQKYADKDNRIKLIHQENAGVSAARNHGLSVAQGEYVMFVDADDMLYDENVVSKLFVSLCGKCDLVIGKNVFFPQKWKEFEWQNKSFTVAEIYKELDALAYVWAKLYKKRIIDINNLKFTEGLKLGEDTIFNLSYSKYTNLIKTIDSYVYSYRTGGYASSIRYNINMNKYCKKIFLAYRDLDDITGKDDVFISMILHKEMSNAFKHYCYYCKKIDLVKKIKETLFIFSPYITKELISTEYFSPVLAEAVLDKDAEKVVRIVKRENWLPIFKKRVKRLYYRFFTKRI